jgi:GntR family transcriptional regulator/MocR family aminotransferase
VIDWARARGGVVLEDDYDGEFRYDRKPVGAVQGLDPERVILLGSVSKSLSPALRLGWMVLPERYVEGVLAAKGEREAWASVLDQLSSRTSSPRGRTTVMCGGCGSGTGAAVTGSSRRSPRTRRTSRSPGSRPGLHAVLRLPPGTERSAVKAAAWQGVALDGLAEFRHPDFRPEWTRRRPWTAWSWGTRRPRRHAYGAALEACARCSRRRCRRRRAYWVRTRGAAYRRCRVSSG